ncbi:MAG: TonB-dependent receptor [Desulfobacterium sp.]|nr:TonB-dependent receptor [Desulfobacterium sp.]
MINPKRATLILVLVLELTLAHTALGVNNEQMAVDARAIALANTVTADPASSLPTHYNPAGLSWVDDGKMLRNTYALPFLKRTGKFTADEDWEGLMGDTWGPRAPYNPDDPLSAHGGPDPLAGTEGTSSSGRMFLPFYGPLDFSIGSSMGLSSRAKDSKWTFAHANYAPYGGGMTHRDEDDPLRFKIKSGYAQHLIYTAPTASLKLTETLSVGLAVCLGQSAMGTEIDSRAPNELVALQRVLGDATKDLNIPYISQETMPPPWYGGGSGPYETNVRADLNLRDDFSPSFNLGLLWRPQSWFSFGICYQSAIKSEMRGDYFFEYSDQYRATVDWNASSPQTMQTAGMLDLPIKSVPFQSGTVTGTVRYPQRVQTGIMVKPMEKLKLLFDVHWADWSIIEQDSFKFDQKIHPLQSAKLLGAKGGDSGIVVDRDMKDTWHWSVGMEYQATPKLCLRAGYEKRPTSHQAHLFDAGSMPDAEFIGCGIGIRQAKNMRLDLSFGYLFYHDYKVPNNTSSNFNSNIFTDVGSPYAGLDYEQSLTVKIFAVGITMPIEEQGRRLSAIGNIVALPFNMLGRLVNMINPFHKDDKHEG